MTVHKKRVCDVGADSRDRGDLVRTRLKPCPFCGCVDIYLGRGGINCPTTDPVGTWGYLAGCKNKRSCGAVVTGPSLPKSCADQDIRDHRPQALAETAAKWNRRGA